jgi:putative salt-induced outer membrane protein YdiY
MKLVSLSLLLSLCSALCGKAEVVYFKNGDRLTGQWLRIQDGKVVLKSEAVGEVEISLDHVKTFASTGEAVLMMNDGSLVEGRLTLQPSGNWQVVSAAGKRNVASGAIEAVYPATTLRKNGFERKPKIWEAWKGKGALGYSLVRGDQNAKTLSVDFNAARRIPALPQLKERARTNYFLNLIFANTEDSQGVRISANSFTTGIRQDFIFSKKNFWFLLAQADHSQLQSLNLRQTYGAGVGRDLLHRKTFDLQALGGMTFVNEHFAGQVIRKSGEGLIGEKLKWQLTRWLSLDHALSFYPNLTDGGRFRIESTSTLSTKITDNFSFNTTYTDHYLSQPLPGHQKNELILTTGVGMTF